MELKQKQELSQQVQAVVGAAVTVFQKHDVVAVTVFVHFIAMATGEVQAF